MVFFPIPPWNCLSPRDHQRLFKTKDIPFIGFLLSKPCSENFQETFDPLLRCYSYGEPMGGMKSTSLISRKTVRKLFKDRFFGFRAALTQSGVGTCGYELSIENASVRLPNSRMGKVLERIGKSILHPFTAQEDLLLRNLKDVPLYSWLDDNEEERVNLPFCPIDGPGISPLKASVRTPRTQWYGCGREWGFRICGDCLGVLGSLPVYLKQIGSA